MEPIKIGRTASIRKGSALWEARFSDRFTTTSAQTAMFCIEHTDKKGTPIYDSYNQWKYFALDEPECDKVLTHLWDEFGTRGVVSVSPIYAGPTFYQASLNPDMCEQFKTCNYEQRTIENIKVEYWEREISMAELLVDQRFIELTDENIDDLLAWAGEDEFCNAVDIREGQALIIDRDQDMEEDREV